MTATTSPPTPRPRPARRVRRTARRRTELGLMLLVTMLIVAAYTLASFGKSASLPADIEPFLAVIIGLFAVAHIALRRYAPDADPILLPLAGLLNGIGYVFIARLNKELAGLQATWTALGIGAFVVTVIIVRRAGDLERYRYTFALIGIALLLMPLAPGIGRNIGGNRIWVRLGPMSFQPGELAKIVLAIFFASYLTEREELLKDPRRGGVRVIGPIVLAWGFSLVVMTAERDLGSSMLFFALFVVMLWLATGRAVYLGIGGVLFAIGAAFSYSTFGHVKERVDIWLHPFALFGGKGYQLVPSLFGLGSGGFTGKGIGRGHPNLIPANATDFIFSAIGEELGLLGTTAILVAFLLIVGAGLKIAIRAHRPFEKLLAAGLTSIIALQTFIIVGGVTRLVPLTGITLPFVSYGGSSLVANYVLLALLLRMSDDQA
jgi:peptidoglycan glycosyltransferase